LEAIVVTWRELLLVVILVLAVYIAEMLLMMRSGGALRKPRWLNMIQEKAAEGELQQQLDAITKRVAMLETSMALKSSLASHKIPTADLDWSLTPPPSESSIAVSNEAEGAKKETETAFQRAVEMAKQGSSADALVEICGISHSEADLIISMQKP
jgi:hypothetical protein